MRSIVVILLCGMTPLAVQAAPAEEAIKIYVDCLESRFDDAKLDGPSTTDAATTTFDACEDARSAIAAALPPDDAKRVLAQIDEAATAGMRKRE